MIKDIVYKIWNIIISIIKFILISLIVTVTCIFGIIFILSIFFVGANPFLCTGSAFNVLALGFFALAGVFVIGIIAGVLGKDEEEIKEDIDNKK